jgi:hypothetical protein
MAEAPAIGIDLGTTYSCVGVFQHGRVEIITNDEGNRMTPSYVAFTDTGRLFGEAAKDQVARNPNNTVFGMSKLKQLCDNKIIICVARNKANCSHSIALLGNKLTCKAILRLPDFKTGHEGGKVVSPMQQPPLPPGNKLTCKAIPLQALTGPEGTRRLRLPDFKTGHDGGKVVSPMHQPPLPPGNKVTCIWE